MKDLLVAFAATTLSIILTFGTTMVVNRIKQKQERKLTALMVMSSIEQFARELDDLEEDLAHKDSIATWLLSIPIGEVAEWGDYLMEPLREVLGSHFALLRDKTADTIFSSSIETWKNMGNFRFIDNVGYAFSQMDQVTEEYTTHIGNLGALMSDIAMHRNDYPGSSSPENSHLPHRKRLVRIDDHGADFDRMGGVGVEQRQGQLMVAEVQPILEIKVKLPEVGAGWQDDGLVRFPVETDFDSC